MLDGESGVPLYRQLVVILENRIRSGRLGVGDLVPGEAALCAEFGVSRITARRALNELSAAGRVVRERGRGTRVVSVNAPEPLATPLEGLLENVERMERATSVDVLEAGYLPANAAVAARLEIAEGDLVQRAVRVRRLNGAPMSHLVTTVPEHVGRRIAGLDTARPLLLLIEAAGIRIASATQTLTATLADAEVGAALGISPGAPLIDVQRLIRDEDGRPVESIRVLYRPELYQFRTTMRRIDDGGARRWRATD